MQPRDYQIASAEALWSHVHQKLHDNPLIVIPTGGGKSLLLAMFIWQMVATYPKTRIVMATHVKELIENNYNTLIRVFPMAPAGIFSAGLKRRDVHAQVTFVGIASVAKRPKSFGHIDFLLVDEAHLISDKDNSSYGKFIAGLRLANPNLVVIGFTATPFRTGSGSLTDGKLFDSIAFDMSDGEAFVWMIDNGYLIRPVPRFPGFELDADKVKIVAGEFDARDAADEMISQGILERAVDKTIAVAEAEGRMSWLVFNQSIEHTELVADMMTVKGYPTEAVHSERNDGDDVLARFKRGELRAVCNMGKLTTGFDHPGIDLICMLRLTRSPGLHVQMIGRGTRPLFADGHDINTKDGRLAAIAASIKRSTTVLDFTGNTERLGPINYPNLPRKKGKGGGDAPVRLCPECNTYNHISKRCCEECGFVFPVKEKIHAKPSEVTIVASKEDRIDLNLQPPPKEFEVMDVSLMSYSRNLGKNGKPDTLRVDYTSNSRRVSSFISFDAAHDSFAYKYAVRWWRKHEAFAPAPVDVAAALEAAKTMRRPKFIKVLVSSQPPDVVAYDFEGTRFELPPSAGGPPLQEPEEFKPIITAEPTRDSAQVLASMGLANDYTDDEIPF